VRAALPLDPPAAVSPDNSGTSTPPLLPLTPPASARAAIPRTSSRLPGYNSSAHRTARIVFRSQRLSAITEVVQQGAVLAAADYPVCATYPELALLFGELRKKVLPSVQSKGVNNRMTTHFARNKA
jgi:hypothetical protein